MQSATKGHVKLLKPAANAQNRRPCFHAVADQGEGQAIAVHVKRAMGFGGLFSVMAGMNIRATAGKNKTVTSSSHFFNRTDRWHSRHNKRQRIGHMGDRVNIHNAHGLRRIIPIK